MRRIWAIILLFFLAGILVNPALAWQIERPRHSSYPDYQLPSRTENSTTDGIASVGLGVNPNRYVEGFSDYNNSDFITMNVTMTANSRMHITYAYYESSELYWIDYDPYTDNAFVGEFDDYGFEVDLIPPSAPSGYKFRFWGGTGEGMTNGSAEYTSVWISTNGFLAFDQSKSNSSTPTYIPDPQAPNAIIAAVWSDLLLDSESAIYYGWRYNYIYSGWSFFVTWNSIQHKASGQRLTFQIVLANAPGYFAPGGISWGQSDFRITYKAVAYVNTSFAFGMEDQEGYRGIGDLFPGSNLTFFNQKSYQFRQRANSSNYFLSKLTLNFNDTNTQTGFYIRDGSQFLRGYNVALKPPKEPDEDKMFEIALAGGEVLLDEIGGVIFGPLFVGFELLSLFAQQLHSTIDYLELRDQWGNNPIPRGAYVIASVPYVDYGRPEFGSAVDATIGVVVHWILDDANNMEHNLTITAKLEYYEVTFDGNPIGTLHSLTTSVNLKVTPDSSSKINNNSFENATEVQEGTYSWLYADQFDDVFDFYKIYVASQKSLQVKIDVDGSLDVNHNDNLNLYLYNGSSREYLVAKSENGIGQDEFAHGEQYGSTGALWYIEVNATWNFGFYNMTISFDSIPLTPSTPSGYSSGSVGVSYSYSTSTTDPDGDHLRYEFDWGDNTKTLTGSYASGITVSASHTWSTSGTYYVKVRAKDPYEAWSKWSGPRAVTISEGGGDSCPTLLVWNGIDYVSYGVIDIHNPTGEDVTREVFIQTGDVDISNNRATFRLREGWLGLNFSESVIDQVRLYAINSQGKRYLTPLISASHSRLGNVLPELLTSDDRKAQILLIETIDLTFVAPYPSIQGFVLIIEGCNMLKE